MNTIQDAVSGSTWSNPHELIDHIVTAHHDYARMMLPDLEQLADRVAGDGECSIANKDQLESLLCELTDLVERHLTEQESWLFPLIRHLHDGGGETEWSYELDESLEWMMDRMARENQELLSLAMQLHDSLVGDGSMKNYPLVADLAKQVQVLCRDMPKHLRLETDVLFPRVKGLINEEGMTNCTLW